MSEIATSKPVVVIHTNDQQLVSAKVGAYSLKARSKSPEAFDVHILRLEDTPSLLAREGQPYRMWEHEAPRVWHARDILSFQPIRRMVPALTGYRGRALVLDPDIFAVGDVWDLLSCDMEGKAVLATERVETAPDGRKRYASAVMLLDCAKLTAWDPEKELEALFSQRVTLGSLLSLLDLSEPEIGHLGQEWNDLDSLTARTKLLHLTEINTQPWRSGLVSDNRGRVPPLPRWLGFGWLAGRWACSGGRKWFRRQLHHPDPRQERFFLELLAEAVSCGQLDLEALRGAVKRRYVRSDIFDQLALADVSH